MARIREERDRRAARERQNRLAGRARAVLLELGHFPSREEVIDTAATRYGPGTPADLPRAQVLRIASAALRIRAAEGARRVDPAEVHVPRPAWDPERKVRSHVPPPATVAEVDIINTSEGEPPMARSLAATRAPAAERDEKRIQKFVRTRLAEDGELTAEALRAEVAEKLGLQVHLSTFRSQYMPRAPVAPAPASAAPEAGGAGEAWDVGTEAWRDATGEAAPAHAPAQEFATPTEEYSLPPTRLRGVEASNGHPKPALEVAPAVDDSPREPWTRGAQQALRYEVTPWGQARVLIDVVTSPAAALRLIGEFAATLADEELSATGGDR